MKLGQPPRRALRCLGPAALGLAVIAAAAGVSAPPVRAQGAITIEANWVDPPVLKVMVGESVTIVNRTGQTVHVEFPGDIRGHLVVQIPGVAPIRVTFLRPGIHPYVVHFPGASRPDLQGTVEVAGDPREGPDLQACAALTSTGVCLER